MRPPRDQRELLSRCDALAGATVAEIATAQGLPTPLDQRHAKGWVGTLIEAALGASAASRPEPDFVGLGSELKNIPIDVRGRPRESTYVCTVPLVSARTPTWETSNVRRKLAHVLWVPVEAEPSIELPRRRVGLPLLWAPSADQEAVLRGDWEELMDMVCLGNIEELSAHHGRWLQVRPKAANARARRTGIDRHGAHAPTLPRGFYLRTQFTAALLRAHYAG